MLSEKQIKLIDLLVTGDLPVYQCLEEVDIPKSTFYDWMKNPNHEFTKTYNEMLDLFVDEVRKGIKKDANKLTNKMKNIVYNGDNENAQVNAYQKLISFAGLDPSLKQEITISNDEESKNVLLEKIKQKKQLEADK